jgi:hypothetical protein
MILLQSKRKKQSNCDQIEFGRRTLSLSNGPRFLVETGEFRRFNRGFRIP